MGPISGIGGGAQYQPCNIRPAAGTGAESSRAATGAGVLGPGTSGGVGSARGVVDVYTAVAELLQSVGGGVENDKVLRMLIMLMILLAIFQNQQDQVAERNNALQALGAGSCADCHGAGQIDWAELGYLADPLP